MRPSWFLTSCALLQCVVAQGTWYFTWTDPSNNTHSESDSAPSMCIEIDNPLGKYFDWSASDGWCIEFWENTNCTGNPGAGHTCQSWPWRANAQYHHLRAFRVIANSSDTTVSTSTSLSSTSTSTSASVNTTTSSPTDDTESSSTENYGGDSLSGGPIAGIVVGVVAGVAMLAVAVWFFLICRRRQKASIQPGPVGTSDTASHGTHPPGTTTFAEQHDKLRETPTELMGNNMVAELSDTHRIAELGTTEIKRGYR